MPVYFSYSLNEEASGGGITTGGFVLGDDPVTVNVFASGDIWDWASFYGTVPVLPTFAFPIAVAASIIVLRKRRGRFSL
jgi:hypothetical protein